MRLAARKACEAGERLVSSTHMLQGIAELADGLGYEILRSRGITAERISEAITQQEGK